MKTFALALAAVAICFCSAPTANAGLIDWAKEVEAALLPYFKCDTCLPRPVPVIVRPKVVCPSDCHEAAEHEDGYCYREECGKECFLWIICKKKCNKVYVKPLSYLCPKEVDGETCDFNKKEEVCECGIEAAPCPKGYKTCPICPPGSPEDCPYSCVSCSKDCYQEKPHGYYYDKTDYYVPIDKHAPKYGPHEVAFCAK